MRHDIVVKGTPVSLQAKGTSREAWRRRVKETARAQIAEADRFEFIDVSVQIIWYCFDWVEGDLDNIAKPILDGLSGPAYSDDGQVVQLFMRRTDLQKHDQLIEIADAPSALLDQLQDSRHTQEAFVFISVSDGDTIDHKRLT